MFFCCFGYPPLPLECGRHILEPPETKNCRHRHSHDLCSLCGPSLLFPRARAAFFLSLGSPMEEKCGSRVWFLIRYFFESLSNLTKVVQMMKCELLLPKCLQSMGKFLFSWDLRILFEPIRTPPWWWLSFLLFLLLLFIPFFPLTGPHPIPSSLSLSSPFLFFFC